MSWSMDLVHCQTDDGIPHEGLIYQPAGAALPGGASPLAVLLVHGAGSRFYQALLEQLARTLAAAGILTLSGNNRGYDAGVWVSGLRLHRPAFLSDDSGSGGATRLTRPGWPRGERFLSGSEMDKNGEPPSSREYDAQSARVAGAVAPLTGLAMAAVLRA